MRLTIALLCLPVMCVSQVIKKDTMWITSSSSGVKQYYQHTALVYEDSTFNQSRFLLGDSAETVKSLHRYQSDKVNTVVRHAIVAMSLNKILRDWNNLNEMLVDSDLATLDKVVDVESLLISPVDIKLANGDWQKGDLFKNPQGLLRLVYGNVGFRVVPYTENLIRIMAWPSAGSNIELFKVHDKVYKSFNSEITIKLLK